jgi:hypothetical protein
MMMCQGASASPMFSRLSAAANPAHFCTGTYECSPEYIEPKNRPREWAECLASLGHVTVTALWLVIVGEATASGGGNLGFQDLTDRREVLDAVAEYDRLGRDEFLGK